MSEKVEIITPKGLLYWIHIIPPGTLNFDEDGYEYCGSLKLHKDSEEAKDLLAQIDAVYNNGHGSIPLPKRSEAYSTCNASGVPDKKGAPVSDYFLFRFHSRPEYPDGSTKTIGTFNAAGDRIDMGAKRIGNGSEGALAGKLKYYRSKADDGVSLFLDGVQIIGFLPYTGTDPVFRKHDGFVGNESVVVDAEEVPKFANHTKSLSANPVPVDEYINMPEL